jgi:hypothetical protein
MKTVYVTLFNLFFVVMAYSQTESRVLQVFFENNSYDLSDESKSALKDFVDLCKNDLVIEGSIEGFTDSKAGNEYNLVLSQNRASAVKTFLQSQGMDLSNLTIHHFGEEKPSANNATEAGMAQNRRVDIKLTFDLGAVERLNRKNNSLLADDQEIAEKPLEEATPTREFNLPNGSIIVIKECSFKGVKMEDVTIVAEEALDGKTMLKQRLNTVDSKGKCLKSGGMVFYKYFDKNGKEIQPQKSCMPEVLIPTQEVDPDLKIYGMSNPEDKKSEWIETKAKPEIVERAGKKYYSSRALTGGINLDKVGAPVVAIASLLKLKKEREIFWKTKGFNRPDVFVHNDSSCVKPGFIATRKFTHEICEPCLTSSSMVTVVARRDGKIYYYNKPFNEHILRRNRYKIPKRDYILVESEEELIKKLDDSLDNMASNG